ncbi:hypothetical protein EYC84_000166 [Monilinia fructicola]|uniref:SMP-30/Gluconolactonase/LRE-like region domain-containing protein n=1 Tax=Monilinia fructicola TaxID=38448 RepID=A0A5M9JSJ7_MONFR|nr:hypothetical protein EYC84_000166 [Monilinia fructicola]
MTTLDENNVLVGDIYNGKVYKIGTTNGTYGPLLSDPKMRFPSSAPHQSRHTLRRTPVGASEVVVDNVPRADDFVFKSDGSIWVAQNQWDELSVVPVGATQATLVAGSNISTTLAGVTSGHFGRTPEDRDILYLATSGALGLPINGTVVVAGSIVKIDTASFRLPTPEPDDECDKDW